MNRRRFLIWSGKLAALSWLLSSCSRHKQVKGGIIGADASTGHLLRDGYKGENVEIYQKDTIIIGGGVSGLTAARYLKQANLDVELLELEKHVGGNAAFGNNELSSFPWGAHYIPVPNNDLQEYLDFLEQCEIITGRDGNGLPVYNELFLCYDPQERLYINGKWQDGLIPQFGVPDNELNQVKLFLEKMDEYRHRTGSDGKKAFAIPVDESSKDEDLINLDKLTMKQWMTSQGFSSSYLANFVNYCCRDDYGTPFHLTSAWAGIHYFASRKGQGSNVGHDDVLTWPEGNGFLVKKLQENIESQIKTGSFVYKINRKDNFVEVDYLQLETKKHFRCRARQCIIAVPQFIASRMLNDEERRQTVGHNFQYCSWMVANLRVGKLLERSGQPLSWDNVLHESQSLGYVHATHQRLNQYDSPERNLTYYLPLTEKSPKEERQLASGKKFDQWLEIIINDLKKVHPNIEKAISEANIMIWGHAMVQPRPGIIHGDVRLKLSRSLDGCIHFAHTDLAGISIFEEAFYQGLKAAKLVDQFYKKQA